MTRDGRTFAGATRAKTTEAPRETGTRDRGTVPGGVQKEWKGNMTAMWKPNQTGNNPVNPPEPARPHTPTPAPTNHELAAQRPAPAPAPPSSEQASIGKSLTIKGEITGSEMLYIDGHVEGSVSLPGNRCVVGRNGQVGANINAREVVILGKVNGNITATDRVDIRNEGSLTGDVVAQRISIEDGAYFKGGIDIRKPNGGATASKENNVAKPATVSTPVSV